MPWATSNQPWTSGDSPPLFVEGYSNLLSYKPGDELRLHVNTSVDSFDVEIARIGSEREVVETLSQVAGAMHPVPELRDGTVVHAYLGPALHEPRTGVGSREGSSRDPAAARAARAPRGSTGLNSRSTRRPHAHAVPRV